MKPTFLWIALVSLFLSAPVQAQFTFEDAVKTIEGRFEPAQAKPGQTVTFKLEVQLNEGYHTYPTVQVDPEALSTVNKIVLPPPGDVIFVEPIVNSPDFKIKADPPIQQLHYYPKGSTWTARGVVSPRAAKGEKTITLPLFQILLCDKSTCLAPKKIPISAKLALLEGTVDIDSQFKDKVEKALGTRTDPKIAPPVSKDSQEPKTIEPNAGDRKEIGLRIQKDRDFTADLNAVKDMLPKQETTNSGFIAFVLTAMFWGAVTLLTPCVFPMIPITVSYFLKQGERKQHNPLVMALVYTLTIVVVLGVAARFALGFFRLLSVDPWMNAALGILFVVFAMSLFGMFDIVLPNFLVRFTSAREGRQGYGGVIFMALSFSIVSFTCVAPFLGGFAGMAASGKYSEVQLLAGSFAFASAFAAPFFLLALFPSFIRKLPKSGGWMNTIKVVMGFLELAAALKFFRNAELRWTIPPVLFTYDFVLSMWIILFFLTGLYLLNLFHLPHDEANEHIGVPRMLVGFVNISIGLYLLPGLFAANNHEKQRPGGTIYAWVDAFLLPEPSSAEVLGGGELVWSGDLRRAIEEARATGDVVLIDFTGVTCTNCKLNERNIFPRPSVKEVMKKFRLVQMYTDTIPPEFYESAPDEDRRDKDAKAVLKLQREVFGDETLPLYVLLKPEPGIKGGAVQVLDTFKGRIYEERTFVDFLKKGDLKK